MGFSTAAYIRESQRVGLADAGDTEHTAFIPSYDQKIPHNCNLNMSGRYIRLPYLGSEGHKTLGNWYTTLLNAHGNPMKHYGDLDLEMSRKKLHQTGPIKQLMG